MSHPARLAMTEAQLNVSFPRSFIARAGLWGFPEAGQDSESEARYQSRPVEDNSLVYWAQEVTLDGTSAFSLHAGSRDTMAIHLWRLKEVPAQNTTIISTLLAKRRQIRNQFSSLPTCKISYLLYNVHTQSNSSGLACL